MACGESRRRQQPAQALAQLGCLKKRGTNSCAAIARQKKKKKKKKKKRGKKRQGRRKRGVFPFWLLWRAFSIFLFCLLGVFVCWFSDLRAALCVSLLSGHMAHGPEMGVLGHSSTLTGFDRWRRMSAFLG